MSDKKVTAPDADDFMTVIYDQEVSTTGEQHDAIVDEFEDMIEAVRQEEFAKGRRHGLKEMDEAYGAQTSDEPGLIEKLRSEYSQS